MAKTNTNTRSHHSAHLPVSPEAEGVVSLPGLAAAGVGLGVTVTLLDTTGLLASGSEATRLAVLKVKKFGLAFRIANINSNIDSSV